MKSQPNSIPVRLTAEEREVLIQAVDPWQECPTAYVDRYLVPAVERLLGMRLAIVQTEPGEVNDIETYSGAG